MDIKCLDHLLLMSSVTFVVLPRQHTTRDVHNKYCHQRVHCAKKNCYTHTIDIHWYYDIHGMHIWCITNHWNTLELYSGV